MLLTKISKTIVAIIAAFILVAANIALRQPCAAGSPLSRTANGQIEFLTSRAGWRISAHRLLWTTNGGVDWKDITPPFPRWRTTSTGDYRQGELTDTFFLDEQVGWALFSYYDEPQPHIDTAFTVNAGQSWTITDVNLPPWEPRYAPIVAAKQLAFSDRLHGWMMLSRQSSLAFRLGALMVTSDGGKTWRSAPNSPGILGSIVLLSPDTGWLVGGPADAELYITRDGTKTWQRLSLPTPPSIGAFTWTAYDLPIFLDEKHAFVAVTYAAQFKKSAAVLFATSDGGITWRADRILTNLPETTGGKKVASTIADSTWIIAFESSNAGGVSPPMLLSLRSGESVRASDDIALHYSFAWPSLSFITPIRGWIVSMRAGLLLTDDGGRTWQRPGRTNLRLGTGSGAPTSENSPHESLSAIPPFQTASAESNADSSLAMPVSPLSASGLPGFQLGISRHLGLDTYPTISPGELQVWWNYSPYFDMGFYLLGGLHSNTGLHLLGFRKYTRRVGV
jgi:photosystem II stability/assembly factor-like uncharacterized protein